MEEKAIQRLEPYIEKRKRLNHLISLISFDVETTAPEDAIEEENDLLNFYVAEYAAISQDKEFIALVKKAKEEGGLNDAQALLIDDLLFDISYMEKLPIEKFKAWDRATSKCIEMWKKAKTLALPFIPTLLAKASASKA